MDLMKLYPFAFAAFSALVVCALPQPAKALPFKKSCASMQSYFNSIKWSVPTKFEGFAGQSFNYDHVTPEQEENAKKNKTVGMYAREIVRCGDGYITESSPMGKKVCLGGMTYTKIGNRRPDVTWQAWNGPNYGNVLQCRYK